MFSEAAPSCGDHLFSPLLSIRPLSGRSNLPLDRGLNVFTALCPRRSGKAWYEPLLSPLLRCQWVCPVRAFLTLAQFFSRKIHYGMYISTYLYKTSPFYTDSIRSPALPQNLVKKQRILFPFYQSPSSYGHHSLLVRPIFGKHRKPQTSQNIVFLGRSGKISIFPEFSSPSAAIFPKSTIQFVFNIFYSTKCLLF